MQPSDPTVCPTCHSPIPADAPGGLCPACALEGAATVASTTASAGRTRPPSIQEIAPHFPELEILELLGAGGMGIVYKARQPQLDRMVALKILSHDLTQDPAFVERFNREAKVLARLSHPNIIAVFDFGTAGPYCYLLMEYVDGVNLRQAMRTGGFTPSEALALVQPICAALHFAHEEGILHRDIKPENILVDLKGRVKIADFGIAKLVGARAPSDVTLTLQGSILGSPHYMAPEQIETPGDVDQRADIYSLGVVLYEMLTGELPIGRFALPSQKAAMDARIDEIVLRTLEKERKARFQSAEDVSTAVDTLAQRPPAASPPAPAAKPGDERPAARFSLTSALLTGASLVLFVVFLVAMDMLEPFSMAKPARIAGDTKSLVLMMIVVFLPAVLGALAGICGFILGASALAQVRKSRGHKEGLGFAIFGVVAWPILALGVLIQASLAAPMPGSGGGGIPVSLAVLLAGISLLLASFVLIRGLRRWARGVERKDGQRHFPGLTGAVLGSLGLAFLAPVLAAVIPGLFPEAEFPDRFGLEEEPKFAQMSIIDAPEDREEWFQGSPEIVVPVRLPAGIRANFLLVQRDEKGGGSTTTIGQINVRSPETVVVKVGAFEDSGFGGDSSPELMVTLRSAGQYFMASTGVDLGGWEFFATVPDAPMLSGGERREFELAKRPWTEESLAEVLHLVVETTSLAR